MRPKVAVLDDYLASAERSADWTALQAQADVIFFHDHQADPPSVAAVLADFDIVVAMRERTPFPAAILDALPRLKLLITTGMRNASIDLEAAARRGVLVAGTGSPAGGTAELAWALITGLTRNVRADDLEIRNGGWQRAMAGNLGGRTLGLVGLGRLGGRVARFAQAFDMTVLAWSPHLTAERAAEHHVEAVGRVELFERADIVSLHLVLGDSTRGLVGEPELRALGPRSFLVNTARALLVDQVALRRSLEEGWIAGAALDVYDEEPLPADHWVRTAPRTLLSPHMGYVNDDSYRVFYGEAVQDVLAFLRGEELRPLNR